MSRALLGRIVGWHAVDDIALADCRADHVIATPAGLLVVVTGWRAAAAAQGRGAGVDLAPAAAAARRVRRITCLPPNPLDVPVYAALLVWGPGSGVSTGWDDQVGVYVLDANRPRGWPAELTASVPADPDLRPATIDEALRKVTGWSAHQEQRRGVRGAALAVLSEVRHALPDHPLPDHRSAGRRHGRFPGRTLVSH